MIWPLRYAGVFAATALGVGGIVGLLGGGAQTQLMTTLHLFVPAVIAALIEGMQWARRHKVMPGGKRSWGFAGLATVIACLLALGIGHLGGGIAQAFAHLSEAEPERLVLYALVYGLCNRLIFPLGVSNHLQMMRNKGEIE